MSSFKEVSKTINQKKIINFEFQNLRKFKVDYFF